MMTTKWSIVAAGGAVPVLAILLYASTTTMLGVGSMPYSEIVNGPAEVTFRQFTSLPGESGGWHYHPGAVFSVVTSGSITIEDGCGEEQTYSAGEAFEQLEGRIHRWKNLGDQPAVELNTFIVPQGSPLAVPVSERRCGPPRSASDCRQDDWRTFDHPTRFANQGECIAYVRKRR
ncbi:MAG TPA: cupin domain-containing protein [Bryobacteraceae bacterium]|nr:cupin domain-containing protein [Bryobacteraceae bacterium]